ncbi:hypothetical protein N2152v2_008422 [Parachlorella kessleri]
MDAPCQGATAADAAAAKAALPQAGSAVFAEPEPSAQYSMQALAGLSAEVTGEQRAPPKTVDFELPWTIAALLAGGEEEAADAGQQPPARSAAGSYYSRQATSPARGTASVAPTLKPSAGKLVEQTSVARKAPRRSTFELAESDPTVAATAVGASDNKGAQYAVLAAALAYSISKRHTAPAHVQPATSPASQHKQPNSPGGGRTVSRAGSYTERHAQRRQQWPLPAHEDGQQATSGATPDLMQWSESKALQKLLRNLEQANAVKQASDARLKKGSATKDLTSTSRPGSRAAGAGLAKSGHLPGSSYKRGAPRERTQPFVPQPDLGVEKRAVNQGLMNCGPSPSGSSSRRVSHFSLAALVAGEPSLALAVSSGSPGRVRTGSSSQKSRAGSYARSPSAVKSAAAAKAAGGLLAARGSPRSASKAPSVVARVQSWGGVSQRQRQQLTTRSATMRRAEHRVAAQRVAQQPCMQEQGQLLPVVEVELSPASQTIAAKAGFTEPHDMCRHLEPPQAAAGGETDHSSGANEPSDTPLRVVYSRLNSFASSGRASAAGGSASEAGMQEPSSGGPLGVNSDALIEHLTRDGTPGLSSTAAIASSASMQHSQQQQHPAPPPAEVLSPPLQQQDPVSELTPRPNQPASPSKLLRWWGKVSPFARLQSPPKTPLEANRPAAVPARGQWIPTCSLGSKARGLPAILCSLQAGVLMARSSMQHRRSPVKRILHDSPHAARLDSSLDFSLSQPQHQTSAPGLSSSPGPMLAHVEAGLHNADSKELPAATLAAVHRPTANPGSPPATAPNDAGELASTSQLLCANSSFVPPLPGDSQQEEGPGCITGTERYEAWQRQQQHLPGGELRQRSLTCPSRTGSIKDPSRSPSRTRLFSQTSSAGGVARSNRSYAELHRYARDTLSSASKKWSPPGSPAGAAAVSPGGSPRSPSLGAWRPPSSPTPHSPSLQRSLTRAASKLLSNSIHANLCSGGGYAQQAAAREASHIARLSALNSTSTEASLAASRAAAWLAAGSSTPAGSPGMGSAELPSESTWQEGSQPSRLVPGSGPSAGGTSSAAGLGSRPGSGSGWHVGLRPGSSSAALSPVHGQDAHSVTVLVGGIHAVHRQRQLERAGSGSKGSGVVRRLSVSAAVEGEAVAAGADGAAATSEALGRTGTGLRASHMRHASVAPGISLQQDQLGRTLLEANPKLQQLAAGSLMQIMQEGRMVHKSWVRPHLKQGGSTRLVRCTLGGGGKAMLTYLHGLFKKPLQSSIKRVIIPTSRGWSPEQYLVVDTDKGMLRLQPSSHAQYALWVVGLNTVLNLGSECMAKGQQEASTKAGAAGAAPAGNVGAGSFSSRRPTTSGGAEGAAAAVEGSGADSSMLLVGVMPWNQSVLIG